MLSSFYKVSKLSYKKTAGARFGSSFVRPAFAGLVLAALTSGVAPAQIPAWIDGCQPVVGAYLVTVTDSTGNFASRQVLTLSEDGNAFVVNSNQGGLTGAFNPFTSEQGSWNCERSPLRSPVATATVLDFSLPGSVAGAQTIARGDYQISFAPLPQTISGSIALRFFPLTGNPLAKPLPPPASTFTFTGFLIK